MAKRKIRTLPRDDDGAIRKRYFARVVKGIETADVETLMESALRACPKKGARCGAAFLAAEAQEIEI